MLPHELIRLILEFHNPHLTTFHSHGDFFCLICWSYNPQKLLEIVSKNKWELPARETQALQVYAVDFMLGERLFKPRASRNKCATKESPADPGWKKIPSRLLASQVKNETRRECNKKCYKKTECNRPCRLFCNTPYGVTLVSKIYFQIFVVVFWDATGTLTNLGEKEIKRYIEKKKKFFACFFVTPLLRPCFFGAR